MLLEAETIMLEAIRSHLMTELSIEPENINIEIDDLAPAIAGDVYYSIIPNAGGPGPHNDRGDLSFHHFFGVRVSVKKRITATPRDRTRTVFTEELNGLNKLLSDVAKALHFNYAPFMNVANPAIVLKSIDGKFIKPLVYTGTDPRPVLDTGSVYASAHQTSTHGAHQNAALKRGINFGKAEFIGRKS